MEGIRLRFQQFIVVVFILHIVVIVGSDVDARERQLQGLQVAHLHLEPRLLARTNHGRKSLADKHRFGESLLSIAQHIHSRPAAPSIQSIVDIVELVQWLGIGGTFHKAIVLHGEFASLRNILIDMDERVDGVEILRLSHLPHVCHAVFLGHFKGTEAGSSSIAHLIIIGVHQLISFLGVSLETDHV